MVTDYLQALLDAQQTIIEKIALDGSLQDCLETLCHEIERILVSPKALSSILLLRGNQLFQGAAPSLPVAFSQAINGGQIGPAAGSCGTAAYTGKEVIVKEIASDPLWADYKDLALAFGLHACWSYPILTSHGQVLGSFAIYYLVPTSPSEDELDLIRRFAHLAGLAIEKTALAQKARSLSEQLQVSQAKFQAFSQVVPDLCLVLDESGRYVERYGGDDRLLVAPFEQLKGSLISEWFSEVQTARIMEIVEAAILTGELQLVEYELDLAGGRRVFEGRVRVIHGFLPESPERAHVLWMAREITERKAAEAQIRQLAFYDPLTQLPNRRLLIDRLEQVIDKVVRSGQYGALFYLDLDDFKRINDSLGHSVGDQLLLAVTARLRPLFRASDTVARIGGDEFVILLDLLEDEQNTMVAEAVSVARKILDCFAHPFQLANKDYRVVTSVGVCLIEGKGVSVDEVLKRADSAMYRSKKMGGNRFAFFEDAFQFAADQRLQLESEILSAVNNRQFVTYFQPQLDVAGALMGAEALIRWEHPEKGIISPIHFIPVAEQSGLISRLQHLVMHEACELVCRLDRLPQRARPIQVAINISASQFRTRKLERDLMQVIESYGLAPERFKLEITESMIIEDMEDTIAQMRRLRKRGFHFSVDDFGRGYSSLAYLQHFPLDELKIDKRFVDHIHEGQRGTAIVDAIIAMSRQLNFHVIAEGVEQAQQASLLTERPIRGMQGFFFARAMPQDEFIDWVRQWRGSPALRAD
ncbi:MAG: EAL domain-containing protein [Hahellaceae bacterium]|nr:EAL domain-containing protein [Hahellaceae bacterium]